MCQMPLPHMSTAGWQTPKIYRDLISCSTQNIHACLQGCHWNSSHNSTLCPFLSTTPENEWCLGLWLLEIYIQILFLMVEYTQTVILIYSHALYVPCCFLYSYVTVTFGCSLCDIWFLSCSVYFYPWTVYAVHLLYDLALAMSEDSFMP